MAISVFHFLTYITFRESKMIVKYSCWVYCGNIAYVRQRKKVFKNVCLYVVVVFCVDLKLAQCPLDRFFSNFHRTFF